MATLNWQKAIDGSEGTVLRHREGCVVVGSYVDGDNTVLLTLPISCIRELAVIQVPTADLGLESLDINYDGNGHDGSL